MTENGEEFHAFRAPPIHIDPLRYSPPPVLDRPEDIAAGRELIIERAVEYLLEELEKPQYQRPAKPTGPIRRAGGGGMN